MGVQGLWKLLESAGKSIPVEKLENKVLSIDVSIWLYQIIKGVQEKEHSATTNRHLIVIFHRICKLLFYGIKPIFVFDGGVPELKKLTIAQRQAQKSRAKKSSGKTKEKMIKNMLEQAALKTVMNKGNTLTEEEVISKTFKSLNKKEENDLFELPKLPETFELEKTETPEKNKEQAYLNLSNTKTENILLLAVGNEVNDFMYTNSTNDKDKFSPKKLNEFSSLQIGKLLNGFSEDQKRLSDRIKQQKSKREMTLNELEMFLNDNSETNHKVDEFSQKLDSDHDTVFYYESNINKAAKSSCTKNDEIPKTIKTSNSENVVETETKNKSQIISATDAVGSPTPTEDVDDDIFKALAGDESLEEDRLAWLIFNENKKASKRRSSEFEPPNAKCFKTETNISSPEVLTSDVEEDIIVKNNKATSKKHSSKSIFITKDESNESFSDKNYHLWVSNSEDEPSKIELEKNESNIDHLHVPSTSKSISPIIEDSIFSNKSDVDQQDITNLSYLESKYGTINNNSRPTDSDHSCDSFSEKSFDLTPEEIPSSSIEISEDMKNNQELAAVVQSSKKELIDLKTSQTELKEISSTINKKLKSPTKTYKKSTKLLDPLDNQSNHLDDEYLLSIQDTLVQHQNDLASLHRTYDRNASSVTQKITSEIKGLLKLFGIPYITAPMEAEAQCAFLEKSGCTEGTVTDDSDVWLFGANVVYKDFFDSQKYVKQFKSIDIKQKFALSRNSFIQLAFLVGSDYTNGIDRIGPVSAIEILSFFESKSKSMNIEEKLLKIKEMANSKSDVYSDVPFVKKLKTTKIGSDFPNKAVINAYLNPIVNESTEKFKWGAPQVDSIVQFAQTNFDWDVSKTKNTLAPVLKKVSARTTQKSLDSYVKTLPKLGNINVGMSKRVSRAVKRMQKDTSFCDTDNSKKSPTTSSKDVTEKKRKKSKTRK